MFGEPVIAAAILDRLLHHSITINIRGKSYRFEEKLKAGLVTARQPKGAPEVARAAQDRGRPGSGGRRAG